MPFYISDDERRRQGLRPYCPCGSGNHRQAEHDARGIFLFYACGKCRKKKLRGVRADVLTDPNYWCDEAIEED